MQTEPIVNAVISAVVTQLKPELDIKRLSEESQTDDTINAHHHSKSITHVFKVEGRYQVKNEDKDLNQTQEKQQSHRRKWYHCRCFK